MSSSAGWNSLCETCDWVRIVTSGTGSRFLLCRRFQVDRRFAKYPPQPVLTCTGYAVVAAIAEDDANGPLREGE